MERRIFATAAGIAAVVLIGVHPASASQCTQACDKSYQDCSATSGNNQVCLPKWGQCKKACSGPAPVAAKTSSPALKPQVTKVASTSKPKDNKAAKGATH